MLRLVAITSLLLAGTCGIAHADVYRWVDERGEPHYSDRWIPGSELIKTTRPRAADTPAPNAAPAKSSAVDKPQTDKLAQNANVQAVKQDVAKSRAEQCKQAKDRYEKAIVARRIYKTPKDGKDDGAQRDYMTDAEADAYRAQARNDVTEACGAPPPAVSP